MKRKNVNRWDLPGWRFEPSYSSRTLVGDWLEERKTRFTKGTMTCVTTNMKDYKTHDTPCYTRDWREMCDNRITQQSGSRLKFILDGDSKEYLFHRLSTYDLEFSSPFRMETTKYQPRKWDRNTQRWIPEQIDLPISENKNLYETILSMKTNLRDLALAEKKDKKLAVFPTPQKSPLKTPKLMYRHFNKTNY